MPLFSLCTKSLIAVEQSNYRVKNDNKTCLLALWGVQSVEAQKLYALFAIIFWDTFDRTHHEPTGTSAASANPDPTSREPTGTSATSANPGPTHHEPTDTTVASANLTQHTMSQLVLVLD